MLKFLICLYCRHYHGHRKCQAFPNGIPQRYTLGPDRHLFPAGDDHGFQFSPTDEFEQKFPEKAESVKAELARGPKP
jgi:hypothetical protein